MRKNKIFFFFLVLTILSACSNTKTEYWDNGNKMSEIEYSGKKQNGKARWWFANGKLQMEANYKNGKLEGSLMRWYINGQQEVLSHYKDDKLNGLKTEWNEFGIKLSEKNYLNDSLYGKAKQWYPNANLMLESAYKNGKYDGEWISYNERSFVISKAKFNNGNGIMESYDIRGNKVLESNFENNLKHGKEIVFDDKGEIKKVRYYDKNQLIKEEEIK